jgi:hypothetical protein
MRQAHDDSRLVNPWGYRMSYWHVFQWEQARYERLRALWRRQKPQTKREIEQLEQIQAGIAQGKTELEAIKRLCWSMGDEAKSSLSFLPRDTGAAMLKDSLLAMEDEYELVSSGELRACAHDAVLAIVHKDRLDLVANHMQYIMQRPQQRLGNLSIAAEPLIGRCWDKKAMQAWERSTVLL